MESTFNGRNHVVAIDADIHDLIPVFLQSRHNDARILKQAIETEDFRMIEKIGHSIKGSAYSFGFNYFDFLARRLEVSAKNRDVITLRVVVSAFEEHLRTLIVPAPIPVNQAV